jgi:hypothetical protein
MRLPLEPIEDDEDESLYELKSPLREGTICGQWAKEEKKPT